jgi:ABC-type iron transport system FetAB permease component
VSSYISLSYWQLAATSVFVLIDAALSVVFGLRVHRSLLFAAVRMVVQLALIGVVLTTLFSLVSPLWTGLAALVMVLFAGHEAAWRQERRLSGGWSYGLGTGSMMMSSVVVTVFALLTALQPNPWYDPRYAIPLLGMILGNCMTGVGLGLNDDDKPRQPPSGRRGAAHARCFQTGGDCPGNPRGASKRADARHQLDGRDWRRLFAWHDDGADSRRGASR